MTIANRPLATFLLTLLLFLLASGSITLAQDSKVKNVATFVGWILSGIPGATALYLQMKDRQKRKAEDEQRRNEIRDRLLYLELETSHENGFVIAKTTLENRGPELKHVSHSYLLIGPEAEGPVEIAQAILNFESNVSILQQFRFVIPPINSINDLRAINIDENVWAFLGWKLIGGNGRGIIPLWCYYGENKNIAPDEKVGYGVPINHYVHGIPPSIPYAARFYIFSEDEDHPLRSTEATFVLPVTHYCAGQSSAGSISQSVPVANSATPPAKPPESPVAPAPQTK